MKKKEISSSYQDSNPRLLSLQPGHCADWTELKQRVMMDDGSKTAVRLTADAVTKHCANEMSILCVDVADSFQQAHIQNRRHMKPEVGDRLLYCSVASYDVRYDRKELVAICVPLVKAVPMSMPAHKHLIINRVSEKCFTAQACQLLTGRLFSHLSKDLESSAIRTENVNADKFIISLRSLATLQFFDP